MVCRSAARRTARRAGSWISASAIATLVALTLVLGACSGEADRSSRAEGPSAARSLVSAVAEAVPAADPFPELTEARFSWGDGCQRTVLADALDERATGLSGIDTFAPYAGMLFVFGTEVTVPFTMRATRIPLHITWYDASGHPVDDAEMEPCPPGLADCPTYESSRSYRYALETAGGSGAAGVLTPCG